MTFHGTAPDILDEILRSDRGLSKEFTHTQAYGKALYSADHPGKALQYAKHGLASTELLRALYGENLTNYPEDGGRFYVLLNRTLLGCSVHVENKAKVCC